MAKQKNIRRDIEKENAELRDSLQKEYQLQSNLVDILQKKVQGQRQLNDTQTSLIDKVKSQNSIEDQLVSIQKAKQKIIDKQAKTGKDVGKALLKRLNDAEQILRVEKAKKDNLAIQKKYQDGLKDSLKDALGLSSKYVEAFKAGGAAALGFLAMTKAVEYISSTIGSIVKDGFQLYKELGIGADEAFRLSTNAFTSLENFGSLLIYGEGFTSSAREAAEFYGRTAEITGDMQRNMATLKKLGVDSTKAVQLDKIFSDAAGDGNDLTDSIKVIAKKEGVTAKKLFEGMADDMSRLVGATEDEIKAMAKTNAQLIKRGLTMKQLEDISDNVLNIEQSMRAEAKARAFIGRDINANGVRQAAIALQNATNDKERNAAMLDMSRILEEQVGSAKDFNNMSRKQRQLFAEAYGMSVDGITEMLTKQKQFNELQAKGMSDEEVLAEIERREAMDASITALKEMGSEAGNLSMAMLPALASFKELGGANTMIGKGFIKATKGAGNLLKKLYEMTAGKLLGKLGGIGKSLGGDMVKSKSGKLFSKDSPQGKMITNLSGKKPKEMIPDTKDMSKTVTDGGKVSGKGGMKDKLKDMAEGLKAMGDGKVFAGIGAVALAGPAFIVALPSIPFLLFMGKVKLKQLEGNFTGLGKGLAQMPQGALGALTMLIAAPALALGMLAIPFLTFMSIPAIGPVIQANFTALAAGLAAFGNPATALFVLTGIGLLAALGAAMIPFAYSLSLLSPLVEAFGNIIIGVFGTIPPIITAVANGFATMFSSVTMDNIGALLLLGPALMGVAAGLGAVGLLGIPGMLVLTGLSAIAPSLIEMATSVKDLFGFDSEQSDTETESKESNTMGELLSEIKGLRQDLQAQPIMVNVDGKVVSRISRVQSRQSVSKKGFGG